MVFKISRKILFLAFAILLNGSLYAGVTGKIKGKITDYTSGVPLPGVNILVEGMSLGSSSDIEGEYYILQVPPGTYNLRISMIGYQTIIVEDVKVSVDLTTEVNAEIKEKSYELDEEVIVVAEKEVVQKDITSSIQIMGADILEALPIISADEGVMLQAGVFFDKIPVVGGLGTAGKGEQRYSVRGGEQFQIHWYYNGTKAATLANGRADWAASYSNVNMNAVEEIQVNTGGFNAEYGGVQAAIVNVVTKTGGNSYHGIIDVNYGLAGQHHFGNYLYDPSTQKEFIDNTLEDGTLDPNWWTEDRQRHIYDYTEIPDYSINFSLGGPIPILRINDTPLQFFLTGRLDQKAYVLPHPRDSRNSKNFSLNLKYCTGATNIRFDGFYNNDLHSTLQENGDFTNQAKYYRGWGSILDKDTYGLGLQMTKVISNALFYDIKLSSFFINFKEHKSDFTQLGESESPTIWGFHRYDGYEDEPFDQYSPTIKNDVTTGDISLVGNLSWQIDNSNLIKTGFEARYNTYSEKDNYRYPSFTDDPRYWINRSLTETFHPIQLGIYLQDKMEFESMILNIGIRYDYYNSNLDWFDQTNLFNPSIDPLYDASLDLDQDFIDDNGRYKYAYHNVLAKPRSPSKGYHMISPRFGVAFPISENTLLHFNYGHYLQMPSLDQMLEMNYFRPVYIVEGMIENESDYFKSNDGDPERIVGYTSEPLKPGQTIMFEVGVKHNFWDWAVLDVIAYYKDFFNQTQERIGLFDHAIFGYDPFKEQITANQSYQTYLSGDYADSRGIEIALKSLFSKHFMFDINYSFSTATQGRATPAIITLDKDGSTTYEWDTQVNKRIGVEKSFSRPHIFRANVMLKYPEKWDEGILGILFSNTTLSVMYQFISGQAFTYLQPEDPADTYNNYRYPASQLTDLMLEKGFDFFDTHRLSMYMRITNLFDNKNLRSYGDPIFDAESTKKFVEDGTVTTVDGAGYDISWQNYFDRRRIWFGIKYSF